MADAVLQGIGVPGPITFGSGYAQMAQNLQQQRALKEREQYAADQKLEARKQQTGEYLQKMLADKNYLSGTDEDPEIQRQLGTVQAKAYDAAQKGASIGDIMNQISPDLNNLNQYRAKAKFIGNEIDQSVNRMKNNKGIDIERLGYEAKKNAFYTTDPTTGQPVLKDVNQIDPTTDWTKVAMDRHPDIANFEGLNEYIKGAPQKTETQNVTTQLTPKGKPQVNQFEVKRPYYMGWDRNDDGSIKTDEQGQPTGLVPNFDILHDDKGNPIGRGVTDNAYNQIISDNPEVAYALRAEQQKAMPGVDYRDPKAQLYMKQHLYDELNARNNTYFKKVEKAGVTPEQQQAQESEDVQQAGRKAAAATSARLNVERADRIRHPEDYTDTPPAKASTMNSLLGVLSGNTAVDGTGKVDIKPYLPTGALKFGPKEKDSFDDVKIDKNTGDLLVKGTVNGKPVSQTIPQSDIGKFLTKIAVYNDKGLVPGEFRKMLDKFEYSGGKFKGFQPTATPTWQQRGADELNRRMGGGVPSPTQLTTGQP